MSDVHEKFAEKELTKKKPQNTAVFVFIPDASDLNPARRSVLTSPRAGLRCDAGAVAWENRGARTPPLPSGA